MKKKKIKVLITLIFVSITMFCAPIYVEAKTSNAYISSIVTKNMEKTDFDKACDANPYCKSDSILGNVDCECSVAWLLQKLLNYIKILGPVIAIVLGTIDFVKAIITSDDDSMKKTEVKFVKRIIAAALLFFIPLLVEILLKITDMVDYTGGIK